MTRPAIQLYSVRTLDEPLPDVVRRVAEAGFEGVEFATRLPDADIEAVAAALDETGVEAVAAHVPLSELTTDLDGLLERLERIDCRRIVIPHVSPSRFRTEARVRTLADNLERLGAALKDRGFELLYHTVAADMRPPIDGLVLDRLLDADVLPEAAEGYLSGAVARNRQRGRQLPGPIEQTGLGLLDAHTRADRLAFEVDVGEVVAAGIDPVALLDRFDGRAPLVHLKDVAPNDDGVGYHSVAPGTGHLDIDAALDASVENDVEWVVYEHDDPEDPVETIRAGATALGSLATVTVAAGDGNGVRGGPELVVETPETGAGSESPLSFRHVRIDGFPPSEKMDFCLTTDLTGNGLPDVIIGTIGDQYRATVPVLNKSLNLRGLPVTGQLIERLETNVFWYENPGWKRHDIAYAPNLSVGSALVDITGNGRLDLVAGQNLGTDLYWLEQPADPRDQWKRRLITDDFFKYHDVVVGDVDGDGEFEIVALSQKSEVIFYYDIPDDPRQSPWPGEYRHVIAEDINVEGAQLVDVDGDGRLELVAGPNVFHRTDDGWEREVIAEGWEWTRVVAHDLDGDGEIEIVMSEGDLPYQGDRMGRLGVFEGPDWTPTILRDDLSNPHTLQVGDFDGDGRPDIFVAEMGLGVTPEPKQYVYLNRGDSFEEVCIESGIPTHEAKAVDLDGDGRLDIVGKSYAPTRHVDVWYNETA